MLTVPGVRAEAGTIADILTGRSEAAPDGAPYEPRVHGVVPAAVRDKTATGRWMRLVSLGFADDIATVGGTIQACQNAARWQEREFAPFGLVFEPAKCVIIPLTPRTHAALPTAGARATAAMPFSGGVPDAIAHGKGPRSGAAGATPDAWDGVTRPRAMVQPPADRVVTFAGGGGPIPYMGWPAAQGPAAGNAARSRIDATEADIIAHECVARYLGFSSKTARTPGPRTVESRRGASRSAYESSTAMESQGETAQRRYE